MTAVAPGGAVATAVSGGSGDAGYGWTYRRDYVPPPAGRGRAAHTYFAARPTADGAGPTVAVTRGLEPPGSVAFALRTAPAVSGPTASPC